MKALIAIAVLVMAGVSTSAFAADCEVIVGWVGVPICEAAPGGSQVPTTNVIGQASSAAADTLLEADGLDLGSVVARCSTAAMDEVVGQDPAPGVLVDLLTLVDILVSNGVECAGGRPGVRLRGLRMPGL